MEIDQALYAQYVTEEKAVWVMYVELPIALYGALKACERLFWEQLSSKLISEWKFIPNKYDSCVINKWVEGKQLESHGMWMIERCPTHRNRLWRILSRTWRKMLVAKPPSQVLGKDS